MSRCEILLNNVNKLDKFQGREAPVVIVSMTSSDIESAPRGAEFLLDRNRLNVALTRAQSLSIIVGSPNLNFPYARSVKEMRLVNFKNNSGFVFTGPR